MSTYHTISKTNGNKCSDRSMEGNILTLLGNYDKTTDPQTNRRTDRRAQGSYTSNKVQLTTT